MQAFWRGLFLLALAALGLQLYFTLRIAAMAYIDPQSTAFERSEFWRITTAPERSHWKQSWTDYGDISRNLKSAVLASEDDGFASHGGVDWDAINAAWHKNAKAQARAEARNAAAGRNAKALKIVGGSHHPAAGKKPVSQRRATIVRKAHGVLIPCCWRPGLEGADSGDLPQPRGVGDGLFGARRGPTLFPKDAGGSPAERPARGHAPRPSSSKKYPLRLPANAA